MILSWTIVIEQTRNDQCQFSKGNNSKKMYRQELRFLWSARCLMMLYISIKFHENILEGFEIIEQTGNDSCQISKGNNSQNVLTRVMVLWSALHLMMHYISMKFHENIFNGFQVTEQTQFCDRRTDDKGKNMSLPFQGCGEEGRGWGGREGYFMTNDKFVWLPWQH